MRSHRDTPVDVERLIHAYNDAWNSHDVDAIVAFHADGMVFDPHLGGAPARSAEDVRAQLLGLFTLWPDLGFRERRLVTCGDDVVQEWTASATLAMRLEFGGLVAEPNGTAITWEGVDVIGLEAGKVTRKESFFDVLAVMRAIGLLTDPTHEPLRACNMHVAILQPPRNRSSAR